MSRLVEHLCSWDNLPEILFALHTLSGLLGQNIDILSNFRIYVKYASSVHTN